MSYNTVGMEQVQLSRPKGIQVVNQSKMFIYTKTKVKKSWDFYQKNINAITIFIRESFFFIFNKTEGFYQVIKYLL